ncbi:MAG: hypothetical protein WDZ49_13210, partial [Litorilinea sp.]
MDDLKVLPPTPSSAPRARPLWRAWWFWLAVGVPLMVSVFAAGVWTAQRWLLPPLQEATVQEAPMQEDAPPEPSLAESGSADPIGQDLDAPQEGVLDADSG